MTSINCDVFPLFHKNDEKSPASIIIDLLKVGFPVLERLSKEGHDV